MELDSQRIRALAPENDPSKIGIGWKMEDLDKPQIMVESIFDDSHLGSTHSNQLVNEAMREIVDAGGKGARYLTTDTYDGITQEHNGINYSLAHRDMIANMTEIHGSSTGFDDGVFIVSYDKSVPACLTGPTRLNMPSIVVTGGAMNTGPDLSTLEQTGTYSTTCQGGEITEEKLTYYKHNTCPSCSACSFIGATSTMQIITESLGLMFPGSALMPVARADPREMACKAGLQVMELTGKGLRVGDIVTMKSFESAAMVYAAISGSINSLLHIPTTVHELRLEIDADIFDRMRRGTHYPLGTQPVGRRSAQFFYYAGGVPTMMEEIKSMLHLDVTTVIGKTLRGDLEEFKASGFYDKYDGYLKKWGLKYTDVIRTFEEPTGIDGTMTILRGNLAPEGPVVKCSAVPREMLKAVLGAKPFDCEEDVIEAVVSRKIRLGDAAFIRYEGSKGSGIPEVFYITEAISSDPELGKTVVLITNGRFSKASKGPAIGHVSPEVVDGRPIAPVEGDDLTRVNILERMLEIIGIKGKELLGEEVERILAKCRRV